MITSTTNKKRPSPPSTESTTQSQSTLNFSRQKKAKLEEETRVENERQVIELSSEDEEHEAEEKESKVVDESKKASTMMQLFKSPTTKLVKQPSSTSSSTAAAITFQSSPYWSYFPHAVPSSSACNRYYESLRTMVDPTPGRIFVYGKYHTENRLTKMFARHPGSFKYSGREVMATGEWPNVVEELYQIAVACLDKTILPADFFTRGTAAASNDSAAAAAASASSSSTTSTTTATSTSPLIYWDTVLINYYRNGSDSISWHSDKDSKYFPIASFSFGAEREFQIRERPTPGSSTKGSKQLKSYSQVLGAGSLLMMHPGMQERYHHAVPKRAGIATGRINITFRLHDRSQSDQPVTATG